MGIDGWIYIAIGDFGFVDAEGTDGTKLTMYGGGVVRVRPDGTGRAPIGRGLFDERRPTFSPDGRLVAYVTEVDSRPILNVRRFDGTGDRVLFNDGDADHPVW